MRKSIFVVMFTLLCGSFIASCGSKAATEVEAEAVDSLEVVVDSAVVDSAVVEVAAEVAE